MHRRFIGSNAYVFCYIEAVYINPPSFSCQFKRNQIAYTFFGPVPINDKQTAPPLCFDPIFIKDAQCAGTDEKTVFRFLRFLFFELS